MLSEDRNRDQVIWERGLKQTPADALWGEVLAQRRARDLLRQEVARLTALNDQLRAELSVRRP